MKKRRVPITHFILPIKGSYLSKETIDIYYKKGVIADKSDFDDYEIIEYDAKGYLYILIDVVKKKAFEVFGK